MISMDFSKPSILRNILLSFLSFDLVMGIVFPIFAHQFVYWKEGMLIWFIVGSILAGISVGLINYWLINKMLLTKLKLMGNVADTISNNDLSNDCKMQSNDFIGDISNSFNKMTDNLRKMVRQITEVAKQINY